MALVCAPPGIVEDMNNEKVKNELAVALFKSCRRFDADFKGYREPMPPWSGTSAAACYHSCELLQPLE